MPTISAGSSQTFTAGVKDQLFTLTANGGALGTVTGAATASFGPGAERRAFGPFAVGQAITVTVQAGSVIIEYGDASPEGDGAITSVITGSQAEIGSIGVASVTSDLELYAPNGTSHMAISPKLSASGTLAAPLGTITGSTGALFSAGGLPITFPAGSLAVGDAIHVYALARKRGANGTATFRIHFGTANSAADGNAEDLSLTNANNQDVCASSLILITSSTVALVNPNVAWNSQGTDRFRELAINTGSTLYLNAAIGSANALDSFDLLALRVHIWRGA